MGGILGDALPPGWDLDGASQAISDLAAATDPTNPAFWNKVGNAVSDVANAAGKTVENLLKDPLPLIATVALSAMGVPPSVAQFIIGMAQGKSPEDAAKGALLSYVTGMASSGISGVVKDAIGDAAGVAVSNMLASGAVGTATALLSGSSLEQALAKGAEAALTSQVTKFIKDSGVDPDTIGGKAILDSAKAAMGAIYAGKNIADAVGKAATSSMIASGVEAMTGVAVKQKDILKLAATNAKNAKAEAAALVARSKHLKDPIASKAKITAAEQAAAPAVAKADQTIANKGNELAGLPTAVRKAQAEEAKLGGPAGATAAYAKNGQKFTTSADLVAQGSAMAAEIAAAKQLKANVAAPRAEFEAESKAYQTQLEAVNKAYGDVKLAQDTLQATSEQIGKYVGSYSDKAVKEIIASPAAAKIIADAKQGIATEKAAQETAAKTAGYKTAADMKAAQGDAPDNFYAKQAGFASAADKATAASKGFATAAAWVPQRAAVNAGFQNATDYGAAGARSAPDFYAAKAGYTNAADQAAATAAGFSNPSTWKAQQAAVAAGFKNAVDKAAAGSTAAPTFYANKTAVAAGYKDAAEQTAANGKAPLEHRASLLGFNSAADQTKAAGATAPNFYAKQAGYVDAADAAKAKAANVTDPALWSANKLGFATIADQAKAKTLGETAAVFNVNQPQRNLGWANAAEAKAAGGIDKEKNAFMATKLGFAGAADYQKAVEQKLTADPATFYAKKSGFANKDDFKDAVAKKQNAAQYYPEKTATTAGYKSVADMNAAYGSGAKNATEFYDQQTATQAQFKNVADYKEADKLGQSAPVFYAEKDAKTAGFANAAEKTAAEALKMNPTDYRNNQIAKSAGFDNYQQLVDSQALSKAVSAGYKSAADQTAAGGKSAKDFYDQQAADAGGYKNVADLRAAGNLSAPDFYAKKAGYQSAGDQTLASIKNQSAADFYADQTAVAAGYSDAKEQASARGLTAPEYRAKQLGFDSYADQIKAGTMPAVDYNNQKAATAAGYSNYADMQAALGTGSKTAKDFYAQQKGYLSYAEEVAAKGKSADVFHADLKAKMAGFDNAEQQANANGLTAADYKATLKGFANAADAQTAGTQSAIDYYNNQKATAAGYNNATDWLAGKGLPGGDYYAQQAGFPDASTQAKAKAFGFSTMAQYQSYQDKVKLQEQVTQMRSAGFLTLNEMSAGLAGGFASGADYRAAKSMGIAQNDVYQAIKNAPPPAPPPVAPITPPAPPVVSPPPVAPPAAPVEAPVAPPVVPPIAPPVTPPTPIQPTTPPIVSPPPVVPIIPSPVAPPYTPPVAPPVQPPYTPPVAPPYTPPVAPPYTPPTPPPYVPPVAPPYVPPEPVAPPYVPPVTPPYVPPAPVTPPYVPPAPVTPPYVPPAPVTPPYVPPAPVTPPFVMPPASTPIVVPPTPPTPVAPPAPVVPVKPAVPTVFGLTPSTTAAAKLVNILANKAALAVPGTPAKPAAPKMTATQQAAYNKAVIDKILGLTPTTP